MYGGREGPSIATSIWRFCNGTMQWKYDTMEMRNGSAQLNNYSIYYSNSSGASNSSV